MVSVEKLASISLLLIGIVFLLQAIAMMYGLVTVGTILEVAGRATSYYGSPMPNFTTIMVVGWVYAILLLITGLVSLLAGGASLIGK
jgi:hypothetical protein